MYGLLRVKACSEILAYPELIKYSKLMEQSIVMRIFISNVCNCIIDIHKCMEETHLHDENNFIDSVPQPKNQIQLVIYGLFLIPYG